MRGHSGRRAGFGTIELPAIGKPQSSYSSCHATFPAYFCILLSFLPTILCDQLYIAVVCILAGTPSTCADAVQQERLRRRREREQQQRTGNSSGLVCAATLDCSHLLMIVAIGIATYCKACPTMLCILVVYPQTQPSPGMLLPTHPLTT